MIQFKHVTQLFFINVSRSLPNITPIESRLANDSFIFSISLTFTILYPVTYQQPTHLYVPSNIHFKKSLTFLNTPIIATLQYMQKRDYVQAPELSFQI